MDCEETYHVGRQGEVAMIETTAQTPRTLTDRLDGPVRLYKLLVLRDPASTVLARRTPSTLR
jgi:hypothetical protein